MLNRLLIATGWRKPSYPVIEAREKEEPPFSQLEVKQASDNPYRACSQMYRLLMSESRKQEIITLQSTFAIFQENFQKTKIYFDNFLQSWKEEVPKTIKQSGFTDFLSDADETSLEAHQSLVEMAKQNLLYNFTMIHHLIDRFENDEPKINNFVCSLQSIMLTKENEHLKNSLENILWYLRENPFEKKNSLFLAVTNCSVNVLDILLTQLDCLSARVEKCWHKLEDPNLLALQMNIAAAFQQLIESPLQSIVTSLNDFQIKIQAIYHEPFKHMPPKERQNISDYRTSTFKA